MKKAFTIVLSIIFVLSLGVYAFAAPGAFLESPSRNPAPTLIDAILPEDCTAKIIITSYADATIKAIKIQGVTSPVGASAAPVSTIIAKGEKSSTVNVSEPSSFNFAFSMKSHSPL